MINLLNQNNNYLSLLSRLSLSLIIIEEILQNTQSINVLQ
jgi:hypothetical protein